jgi:radical SAM protein with 4Fe4S-binding SPASM domain
LLQYPMFRTENVRDKRLAEIVTTNPALAGIRASVTETLHPCKTCIIKNHCGGGCRGIHFSFTHDYVKAHPLFCAYLRRAFESQAWASAGQRPSPRRSEFYLQEVPAGVPQIEKRAAGSASESAAPSESDTRGEAFIPLTSLGLRRPS